MLHFVSVSVDSFAPAHLALWVNLRLLYRVANLMAIELVLRRWATPLFGPCPVTFPTLSPQFFNLKLTGDPF